MLFKKKSTLIIDVKKVQTEFNVFKELIACYIQLKCISLNLY